MAFIGYLIRTELKKQIGGPADEVKTWLILPPTDYATRNTESAEAAFAMAVEATLEVTRSPVIEEHSRRRVFVEDLRPFRNSLVLEKDGWRCFSLRFV